MLHMPNPTPFGGLFSTFGDADANSTFSQSIWHTTPNGTLSGWTQLIASTPFDVKGMFALAFHSVSTGGPQGTYDIGIGASGSEVAFIEGLNLSRGSSESPDYAQNSAHYIPFRIPAGSRIAYRARLNGGTSANTWCSLFLDRMVGTPGELIVQRIDPLGVSLSTLNGTEVTPGLSNTFGSWTQIHASTARAYRALIVEVYPPVLDTWNTTTSTGYIIQFATGAGGSEVAIPINFKGISLSWRRFSAYPVTMPIHMNVPEGTRLSCRMMASAAAATALSAALYGVV